MDFSTPRVQCSSPLEVLDCITLPAQFAIRTRTVIQSLDVIRTQRNRPVEVRERLVVLPTGLLDYPAITICAGGVRLQTDDLIVVGDGFVKLSQVALGSSSAKVCIHEFGLLTDRGIKVGHCVPHTAKLCVGHTSILQRLRIHRLYPNSRVIVRDGFAMSSQATLGDSADEVCFRVLGLLKDFSIKVCYRVFDAAKFYLRHASIPICLRIYRLYPNSLVVVHNGFYMLFKVIPGNSAVVVCFREVRLQADHSIKVCNCILQTAEIRSCHPSTVKCGQICRLYPNGLVVIFYCFLQSA